MIKIDSYVCKVCGKEQLVEAFPINRFGRSKVCSSCIKQKREKTRATNKQTKTLKEQVEESRQLRLQDFQPNELMKELKRRGYTFIMKYTEVHVIDSKNL